VLIELFSLDVTGEALRTKIDGKSAISLQRSQFDQKFQVKWSPPPLIFARIARLINECLTILSLTVFTQTNYVADFLQAVWDFTPKTAVCVFDFEPPLGA